MKELFLYGASGHGKVAAEIAEEMKITVRGFIDDNASIKNLMGYPVFPKSSLHLEKSYIFLSIGDNLIRRKISIEHPEFNYIRLISPKANLSSRCIVGEGSIIMPGVSINCSVEIGKHCIINTNASIDHDCFIEDYVHISPNVALAGMVKIGTGTQIGIGASVIQGIQIGKNCMIGAGSVIIKNIPDNAVVVGNPGRIIRYK